MKRALYLFVCALFLGGIVHIAIILMIPKLGSKDAWTNLAKTTTLWSFEDINTDQQAIANVDPYFQFGACQFDLSDTGLVVEAPTTNQFWAASVFNSDGKIIYSLTNRTSDSNKLQLLVLNPIQRIGLREFQPKLAESAIVVEADMASGFFVMRLFSPDDSYKEISKKFMDSVSCSQYEPSAPDASQPQDGADDSQAPKDTKTPGAS